MRIPVLITAGSPPTELEARLHLALSISESKIGPMSTFTREKNQRGEKAPTFRWMT
jgi:hypothetical protein